MGARLEEVGGARRAGAATTAPARLATLAALASLATLASLAALAGCGQGEEPSWREAPAPGASWQLMLGSDSPAPDAEAAIVDIDGQVSQASIDAIRAANPDVYLVCYFSLGTWEQWRDDAAAFPTEVIGTELPDWPGERYVDLRALDVLGPIWHERIDDCAAAGFDAVDPDNLDAFANASGFELTEADAVAAFTLVAEYAHERGLGVGQKNAGELTTQLVELADFAVVEECLEQGNCGDFAPYVEAGKPVLAVEYPADGAPVAAPNAKDCATAERMGLSLLAADWDLAKPGLRCP